MYRSNRQAIKRKLIENCFSDCLPTSHPSPLLYHPSHQSTLEQHLNCLNQQSVATSRSKSPMDFVRITPPQPHTIIHVNQTARKPVSLSRESSLRKTAHRSEITSVKASPYKADVKVVNGGSRLMLVERRETGEDGREKGKQEVVEKSVELRGWSDVCDSSQYKGENPPLRRKKSGLKITSNFQPCILGEGVHKPQPSNPLQTILKKIHKEQILEPPNCRNRQNQSTDPTNRTMSRAHSTKKKLNLTQPTFVSVNLMPTTVTLSSSSLAR